MATAVDAASRRPGMAVGNDDLETLDLLLRTPGSLAPTSLGLLTTAGATATVFAINGKAPSLASLGDGSYPWRKQLSVVLPPRPTPLAERFSAFLRGKPAAALLRRHDYLPLSP